MYNDFTIGRNDFSVTVYVPWNCDNNCKFCSSKKDYLNISSNYNKTKEQLLKIHNSVLPIIVFTGGEPSSDIEKLKELISIVDNKIVYINTTLPKKNSEEFINLINETECVKGVSISRHKPSYEEDCLILNKFLMMKLLQKLKNLLE